MKLSPQQIHDAKRFYKFFESIPENKWCKRSLTDKIYGDVHCTLGHLGCKPGELSQEAIKLCNIINTWSDNKFTSKFGEEGFVILINDSSDDVNAKYNILSCLDEIIKSQHENSINTTGNTRNQILY